MKTTAIMLVSAVAASQLLVGSASATSSSKTINIPIDTVVRAEQGSTKTLQTTRVAASDKGRACSVKAEAANQRSIHPGNNLVVKSGDTMVVLRDVERSAGVMTNGSGKLTLDDEITVSLTMGKDKVFSGGLEVKIECDEAVPAAPVAEEPEAETPVETPAPASDAPVLPETGPGALLGAAIGGTGLALASLQARASRKRLARSLRSR